MPSVCNIAIELKCHSCSRMLVDMRRPDYSPTGYHKQGTSMSKPWACELNHADCMSQHELPTKNDG